MKIEFEPRGKYLLIRPQGRLDAAWSEYFTGALLEQIRNGRHELLIDASQMAFLSSAGIRSLLIIYKALGGVGGRFLIVNAADFVARTLRTTGFHAWLADAYPGDMPAAESDPAGAAGAPMGHFVLDEAARLHLSDQGDWRPWQAVADETASAVAFPRDSFGLGIGSAGASMADARDHFGEFLAVAGNVVYQPPDGESPPDYLIAEKDYIPRMQCLRALKLAGEMAHLIRFAPTEAVSCYTVSALLSKALEITGGKAAGFVILGEIEGLVGTALIRSPGRITEGRDIGFPEIRDWLSFCGERCHCRQQALLAGVVSAGTPPRLPPVPTAPDLAAHIHGAVFPYQPLKNGNIDLAEAVGRFFGGPPPLTVMHLAADDRPAMGLGESALVRGACWFAPVENPEVLK